jgi:hypothetical protein|tara:strand:+ start:1381 stop:1491 length:111 start_codon:yes stop_codon:yes gene_type:complete
MRTNKRDKVFKGLDNNATHGNKQAEASSIEFRVYTE